jgi:hypothetical protein
MVAISKALNVYSNLISRQYNRGFANRWLKTKPKRKNKQYDNSRMVGK